MTKNTEVCTRNLNGDMDYIKDKLQSKEHTPSPNVNLHTMLCNRTHQLGQKKNKFLLMKPGKISFVAGPLGV